MTSNWAIEVEEKFDRFFDKLGQYEQAVLTAAIEEVLQTRGIDICQTEYGKNIGQGLVEFRVRQSLQTLLPSDKPFLRGKKKPVLLRVFCHFHGSRVVLLLGGYDKGRDPSAKRQQKEIKQARKQLEKWKKDNQS